jgi:hypothetical protein
VVRPSHGRTAPLTVAVRLPRRPLSAVLLATAALAAAGCGGSQVSADEVPGPPPNITVPSDAGLGGGGGADDASGTTGATDDTTGSTSSSEPSASTDTTPAPDTSADTGTTGTTDTGTAETGTADTGTTEPAPTDTTGTDQTASPSETEQFEDFCAQNEGAC